MSKGGGGGAQQAVEQKVDPEMKAAYLENLGYAKDVASRLGQRQFADFTPTYGRAEEQMSNLGLTPFSAASIREFYNPYETEVVNTAMADIERQRQLQDLQDRSKAASAGAFGGTRQGVTAALTNEAALRNAASTAAQMRAQGYQTAAQQAMSARQANLQGYGLVMSAAQQRQALEQERLDAARNLELERLGVRQAALSAQPANLGMSQTQTGGGGNRMTGALGAGLAGYAMTGNPYIAGGAAALSLLG